MTVREAAKHYKVSVRTIRQWIRDGKVEAEKRGPVWDVKEKKV